MPKGPKKLGRCSAGRVSYSSFLPLLPLLMGLGGRSGAAPSSCRSALPRGCPQGVPSCRAGPARVAAPQARAGAGRAPPGCLRPARAPPTLPRWAAARRSAQPRPQFCVVLSCPVPPPPRPLPCISQPSLAGFQSLQFSPPGFAGRLGCAASSPAEEGGEVGGHPWCRGLFFHCSTPSPGAPAEAGGGGKAARCPGSSPSPSPAGCARCCCLPRTCGKWTVGGDVAGAAQLASPPGSAFLPPCSQHRGLEQSRGSPLLELLLLLLLASS